MRIAFDYQTFVGQSYGGISRYFTRLAQGLLDFDQQVKIFAPLHRNSYLSSLPPGAVDGRFIGRFPPKTTRFFIAYNHISTRFKIKKWQPDLVHETYYSNVGTAPNNCQTVITVYDMIQELFPNEFEAQENKLKLKRRAIERADHIICISECTKNDLMRLHGTPANKISLVHLGFDQFAKEEGNNVFSHCFDKPFILYVGQRGGYKNFLGLIKSFASSNKLLNDFDIVAFGGGKFTTAELSLIQSLGFAANQVKQVCGNDDLLGRYYQSAKAFVYPSFYEGFGIPPLEAMAHQCPVISSNKSSMPEVIGIAAEYFDPNVFEDIRLAIENVVYSESRADELRKEGLARLLKFSWKKCTYETLDIYQSLSGNN